MSDFRHTTDAVAVGILVDEGLALVARRRPGQHLEGRWEFPGGKVQRGETCEQALRREFHEEIGVGFDTACELCKVEHRYVDRTVLLTFFLCTGMRGEASGRERQEIRWVDAGELEELSTPEANRAVIRRLEDILVRRRSPR